MSAMALAAPVSSFAAPIDCDELANMVRIGVPEAVVVQTVEDHEQGPSTEDCLASLPEAVRAAFVARPLPTPDKPPEMPPEIPAPALTVAPTPETEAALRQIVRAPGCDDLSLALRARYPATATALSGGIGFGAGHFYAERPGAGFAFLVAQLGTATGAAFAAKEQELDAATGLTVGALALRVADIATAHLSARAQTSEILHACRR